MKLSDMGLFSPKRWTGNLFDVAAVMSFARYYPWSEVTDPEYAAAFAVWQIEQKEGPLHEDARRGLLAALTTSARHHAMGAK